MNADQFNALVLKEDGQVVPRPRTLSLAELPAGDVLGQVHYSNLNFKNSMALANSGSLLDLKLPLIPCGRRGRRTA